MAAQLFDEYRIRGPQQIRVFPAHLAEDAYREPRAREGMAIHHLAWQAELDSHAPYLVLEELAQWLDQLQVHLLGQATDVVMRFDDVRLAGAGAGGFDDVGVDRALSEKADAADPVRFLIEYFDEGTPDDLACFHPRGQ